MTRQVERLGSEAQDEIVRVLSEAFTDYPVMRYVLGRGRSYARDLGRLISFFVGCRMIRGDPVFGIRTAEGVVAVATTSRPDVPSPESLAVLREETFGALGDGARRRYGEYGRATAVFHVTDPHIHLNLMGTLGSARGQGMGRTLLEAVHAYSAEDATSRGVTLTTETRTNVALYERFGYEVLGEASVGEAFTTWGMYKRTD